MVIAQIQKKVAAQKPAIVALILSVAAVPAFADGTAVNIDWGSLASQVLVVLGQAVTAGVSVYAMYLGVQAGIKMFRKFIG
ncbi:hypothetical protein [Chromobacterium violaceum]|uniref:hypothetical protein n=1 Tax=Chromobacterium violaceum TaxID=536 RepID=UPI00194EBC47|nr:hypothetical protein [Chromobacterium violaceum]QRO33895.1 hypothetical protein I6K04_03905 [Chromobacterium violaceum]QRQ16301.1 hypothetical protein I6K03_18825 [Chromobacterium violaceum]